jgi:hypothetical protein
MEKDGKHVPNDLITIDGTQLGGTSVTNDVVIKVKTKDDFFNR